MDASCSLQLAEGTVAGWKQEGDPVAWYKVALSLHVCSLEAPCASIHGLMMHGVGPASVWGSTADVHCL